MIPPAPSTCTVCEPSALEAQVRANPALATLWQALPLRRWDAAAQLQAVGEVTDRCWLLRSGVVRLFYLNADGMERNRSFHGPGLWIAGSLPPQRQPSPYAIETLTPVEAVELDYAVLQQWQCEFPAINGLLEEVTGYLFSQHARKEADLLSLPAEARYRSFLAQQGDIARQIPQHHVASYLGISPVSLSRIRARLGMIDEAGARPAAR